MNIASININAPSRGIWRSKMSLRSGVLAAAVALPLALAGHSALAVPYTFNSSGSFSDCIGCAINSDSTKIGWGGSNSINGAYNGSTLAANPLSGQTGNTPAIADTIAELTWVNKSTSSENTSNTVAADYLLSITFSQPAPGGSGSDTFDLSIVNTGNTFQVCGLAVLLGGCNDTTGVSGQNPTITVDGLIVSNLTFSADNGSSFDTSTGIWSNPENNSAHLFIKANIAAAPSSVPEPVSLVLLGTGLVGLSIVSRRRRNG